ncbi:hypothetical protein LCGC14_2214560, partial [marine sediment metagenome]
YGSANLVYYDTVRDAGVDSNNRPISNVYYACSVFLLACRQIGN